MRITGGIYRGRKLEAPKGYDIRPTTDKVRQAVFNMLRTRDAVKGVVVLDAFCGTGALGLEALSQGAGRSVFLDKSRTALDLCRRNVKMLGVEGLADIRQADSGRPGARPGDMPLADLVFLDPPYGQGLAVRSFQALTDNGWIAPVAVVVVETGVGDRIVLENSRILQEKVYGDTQVMIFESGRLS